MNKAEQNYLLLREIEENRRFLLMAYRQNPDLLENAEDRIKEILTGTRYPEPDTRNPQSGISLIELVMFIVITGIALAGVLLVMDRVTAHSADPLIRKQSLAIAESLLEEIELMPFTFCDPNDASAASAVSAADCTGGAGGANDQNKGGAALTSPTPAAETRYSATDPFDNVADYGNYSMTPIADITGAAVAGLNSFAASVAISRAGNALLGAADDGAALRITVTVDHPGCDPHPCITLDGYRTRYAPRALP